LIYAGLLLALIALLLLAPAEATLGNVVKIVYAHGAAQRIATYAYLVAGALGVAGLVSRRHALARWTRAVVETAIVFWLAALLLSLPAQVLAWGGITLNEPRVASAVWSLGLTALVYGVARGMGTARWISLAAIANTVIVLLMLRGAVNVLHPLAPILASDSAAIQMGYAAIVLVTGALAIQLTRDLARGRDATRQGRNAWQLGMNSNE